MKFVELFVIVAVLCFGAAGWWYAGSFLTDIIDAGFSGIAEMGQEALQGMLNAAGDAVAIPLDLG